MTEPVFGRLVAAMVTPFDADLNVDFARAQALAKRLVDGGCDALAVCATTGESPTISHEDKLRLFKEVAEAVAGRAKVIAYCGGNNTAASVADAKEYAALGCIDGFLTVVPYYNKPPQA
ncbi:MAG: dihydrodipicolinate synthase family protein, partial [Coriobacteriales bacterium]